MPTHRKLFRFRFLLTLSLAYGCTPQTLQISGRPAIPQPQVPVADSSLIPSPIPVASQIQPQASVKPEAEIKLLSLAEIDQLKASGLVEANNRFGWQLFHQIYTEAPESNLFMSPISAALALQMVLQGADGQTLSQMKKTLGLESLADAALRQSVPLLIRKLQRPAEDVRLELANSLWANQKFSFLPEFTAAVKGPFDAQVENADFTNSATPGQINQWTAKATHDKIPQIVDPQADLSAQLAILMSAIYFNAKWTIPFEKVETKDKAFYLENGTQKQVPMMRLFENLPYLSPSENFPYQGIALPYGKQSKLRMYLFLPTTGKSLVDLQKDLLQQDFEQLRKGFYYEGGSLELPRFKLEWNRSLKSSLKQLGMPLAFDEEKADFLKMARLTPDVANFCLSEVQQFSFVDVKEEGTEAAAVTVVYARAVPASSEPQRSHSMIVNHPFVFVIRDEETGQNLFMGSITDPAPELPASPSSPDVPWGKPTWQYW